MNSLITIDGPAASGKTSVSREVAQKLNWKWVSTGVFYRGIAYVAREAGIPTDQSDLIVKLIAQSPWEIRLEPLKTVFAVSGVDVSDGLMTTEVGEMASQLSQHKDVRAALLSAQRRCVQLAPQGLIAEGRDCGTVVFPNAPLKVYLTARGEERAARRAREEEVTGMTVAEALHAQRDRDQRDSQRPVAPLRAAEGAIAIDTSELSLSEVVNLVLSSWEALQA